MPDVTGSASASRAEPSPGHAKRYGRAGAPTAAGAPWIAESIAEADKPLELSPDEELLLKQAREDFRFGRTLSLDDYKADLDVFFRGLRAKSKSL